MIKVRGYLIPAMTMVFLVVITCTPLHAYFGNYTDKITEAENLLKEKKYQDTVTMLNPMLQDDVGDEIKAKIHFLMGRAFYENAFAVISAGRVDGKVKFKDIAPQQVKELKTAAEHFMNVVEIDPENDLASDAYFMLGKVWDYDCLQKFKKSQDSYKQVIELSPDSEKSTEARECVDRIEGYFQGHGSTH